MSYQKKRKTITEEPCILVYTLHDSAQLSFDDFSLIIRGLHTYMVEDVVPYPTKFTVHVKLGYQASIENATKKLGDLAEIASISKLSSHVKEHEITRLQELKQRFGIAGTSGGKSSYAEEDPPHSRAWKQTHGRYKNSTMAPPEV